MSEFTPRRRAAVIVALLSALGIAIPAFFLTGAVSQPAPQPTPVAEPGGGGDEPSDPPPEESGPFSDQPFIGTPSGGNPLADPATEAGPPASPDPRDPATDPADPPAPAGPLTVVSLTFDDGGATQLAAKSILDGHGVDATFYINSGTVGIAGFLTLSDLYALSASGHEIGGHSVTHPDLVALPADEVRRQVCDDRAQLLDWGFAVRSFAYPFASASPAVEQTVEDCGYNSGRMLGDVVSPFSCAGCVAAETMPPADPYYTRAPDQYETTWTLDDMKAAVVRAEAAGGWLQFTFHDVCTTSCGTLGVSESVLEDFLEWLAPRQTTGNTVVRTVGDVIGGAVRPAVRGPVVPPPAPAGVNGIVNPGLESSSDGVPTCWYRAPWGSNSPSFSLTSPGHTGATASRIEMSGYLHGDAKILPVFDLGACAPSVEPGESYSLRAWYTSTAVTQFAVYLRTTGGGWVYWTSSPWFAATSVYTEAEWITGPIPAGYNGISFGLNIFSDGVLVTDDYAIYNVEGAPPAAPPPAAASFASPDPGVLRLEPLIAEPPAETEPPAGGAGSADEGASAGSPPPDPGDPAPSDAPLPPEESPPTDDPPPPPPPPPAAEPEAEPTPVEAPAPASE